MTASRRSRTLSGMGEDSKAAGRAGAEQGTIAFAVLVAAAAAKQAGFTDDQIAASSVVITGFSTYLTERWRLLTTQNDRAAFALEVPQLTEQVSLLTERIAKIEDRLEEAGEAPEPLDTIRANVVFSEFARGVSEAATPAKRRALVNAAAHQFDPEFGEPSVRVYWLRRVRALSDLDIRVLGLITEHVKIAFNPTGLVPMNVEPFELVGMPPENLTAFKAAALELAKGPGNLVQQDHGLYTLPGASHSWSGELFTLALDGKIVARYIAD
ncbi:MAG: hypothetical protein ABI488_05690 [Polyangiaceae bacterium]